MVAVLQVRRTGELFRLVDQTDRAAWIVSEGAVVRCYDALVWTGRGRMRKKVYDQVLPILFILNEHRIMDVMNDDVLRQEIRRAKERMCWRFHPGKCSPKPGLAYSVRTSPPESKKTRDDWLKDLLRLSKKALDYLERPSSLKETEASVLKFDLRNVLDVFKATELKGEHGGSTEKGEAAQEDAAASKGLHSADGQPS